MSTRFTTSKIPNEILLSNVLGSVSPWSRCRCNPNVIEIIRFVNFVQFFFFVEVPMTIPPKMELVRCSTSAWFCTDFALQQRTSCYCAASNDEMASRWSSDTSCSHNHCVVLHNPFWFLALVSWHNLTSCTRSNFLNLLYYIIMIHQDWIRRTSKITSVSHHVCLLPERQFKVVWLKVFVPSLH